MYTKERLKTKVFQALGTASMCWDPTPTGEFVSTEAKKVGDELWSEIEKLLPSEGPTPPDHFCKVFNLGQYQVLLQTVFNDDNEEAPYGVELTTELDGIALAMTMGFATKEDGDKCFQEFNEDKAMEHLLQMQGLMSEAELVDGDDGEPGSNYEEKEN